MRKRIAWATVCLLVLMGMYACGGGGSSSTAPSNNNTTGDTTVPSTPTGLLATAVSTTQISLSWTASTDNVAVTGYEVWRGTTKITSVATTTYVDSGLTASTSYTYIVKAYDSAANTSSASASATAITMAISTGGNYFPHTLNDTWTYRNVCSTSTVTFTDIVTQSSNASFTLKDTDTSWTGYYTYDYVFANNVWGESQSTTHQPSGSSSTTTYSPALTIFPTQTSVGTHETYTSAMSPGNTNWTHDLTVSAIESVTVTAGTFNNTVKLNVIRTIGSNPSESYTIWYADGVGMIKQVWDSGCTNELLSYTIH